MNTPIGLGLNVIGPLPPDTVVYRDCHAAIGLVCRSSRWGWWVRFGAVALGSQSMRQVHRRHAECWAWAGC